MHSTLKIFFWNYDEDDGITSEDERQATLEESLRYMENLPDTDGNFFGLELPGSAIVQFMHDEHSGIILDIPVVGEGGSFTKTVDLPVSLSIIRETYNGKKPKDIEGLVFESY